MTIGDVRAGQFLISGAQLAMVDTVVNLVVEVVILTGAGGTVVELPRL